MIQASDTLPPGQQEYPRLQRAVTGMATGLALCGVLIQARSVLFDGKYLQVGTLAFYVMFCFLFLLRHPSRYSSRSWHHWAFAFAGMYLPFLLTFDANPSQHLVAVGLAVQA